MHTEAAAAAVFARATPTVPLVLADAAAQPCTCSSPAGVCRCHCHRSLYRGSLVAGAHRGCHHRSLWVSIVPQSRVVERYSHRNSPPLAFGYVIFHEGYLISTRTRRRGGGQTWCV